MLRPKQFQKTERHFHLQRRKKQAEEFHSFSHSQSVMLKLGTRYVFKYQLYTVCIQAGKPKK